MKNVVLITVALLVSSHAFFVHGSVSKSVRHGMKRVSREGLVRTQMQADAQPDNFDGKVTSGSLNLAKNVLGAGVLSLSSGVAFFTDMTSGLAPACLLTGVMGMASSNSFKIIGEMCAKTNSETLQETWTKLVGPGAELVGASVTSLTFMAALAYSIILADSVASLGVTFNAPVVLQQRNNCLLAVTSLVLLPLCSMKSLAALAPFSVLGLIGVLYTAVMMFIRLTDRSYAVGGVFFDTIAANAQPSFAKKGTSIAKTLVLTSMLATNYICHYNAPRFLNEIKVASMGQTLRRYNKMADLGFLISIFFSMLMMLLGFLTFGGNAMGFVLNNYASSDALASFSRFAIATALLTSYPLAFLALRDGVFDFFKVDTKARDALHYPATIAILGMLTSLAFVLKDVGFVVSIAGALFGSMLIFGIPYILKNAFVRKGAKNEGRSLSSQENKEILVNRGMMGTGAILGVLGVYISIMMQVGKL